MTKLKQEILIEAISKSDVADVTNALSNMTLDEIKVSVKANVGTELDWTDTTAAYWATQIIYKHPEAQKLILKNLINKGVNFKKDVTISGDFFNGVVNPYNEASAEIKKIIDESSLPHIIDEVSNMGGNIMEGGME